MGNHRFDAPIAEVFSNLVTRLRILSDPFCDLSYLLCFEVSLRRVSIAKHPESDSDDERP
eukprot:9982264-Heterocapsa_arctica.AAC.1